MVPDITRVGRPAPMMSGDKRFLRPKAGELYEYGVPIGSIVLRVQSGESLGYLRI